MACYNDVSTAILGDSNKAEHCYDVEISSQGEYVIVYANNRDQAGRIAAKEGYTVRSVNMVG